MRPGHPAVLIALATVAVLVGAELGARALGSYLPPAHDAADETTAHKIDQLEARSTTCTDVVFVGNSMARDAFDPHTFTAEDPTGRTAYNAALDAATPLQMTHWLDERVLPATRPAVVVLATTAFDLSSGNRAGRAAALAAESATATRSDWLGTVDRTLRPHLALLDDRDALRDPTAVWDAVDRWRTSRPPGVAVSSPLVDAVGLGQSRRELRFAVDPVHDDFVQRQLLDALDVDPVQVDALVRTTDMVRAAGAQPVLAVLPVTDHFRSLHGGGGWDDYIRTMQTLAEATATPLLRLDEPAPREATDEQFADSHHLNGTGATLVTASLPRRLAQAGVTDRAC